MVNFNIKRCSGFLLISHVYVGDMARHVYVHWQVFVELWKQNMCWPGPPITPPPGCPQQLLPGYPLTPSLLRASFWGQSPLWALSMARYHVAGYQLVDSQGSPWKCLIRQQDQHLQSYRCGKGTWKLPIGLGQGLNAEGGSLTLLRSPPRWPSRHFLSFIISRNGTHSG